MKCTFCDKKENYYGEFLSFGTDHGCPEHEAHFNAYIDSYATWLKEEYEFDNRLWVACEVFKRITREQWQRENPKPKPVIQKENQ